LIVLDILERESESEGKLPTGSVIYFTKLPYMTEKVEANIYYAGWSFDCPQGKGRNLIHTVAGIGYILKET